MTVRFVWDDQKARANLLKHGVSFEEAQSVFDDPLAIIAGTAESGRLLLVSFMRRGDSFRIISARELTKSERQAYEENRP
jgi:uncharacterized DUF497 family protein